MRRKGLALISLAAVAVIAAFALTALALRDDRKTAPLDHFKRVDERTIVITATRAARETIVETEVKATSDHVVVAVWIKSSGTSTDLPIPTDISITLDAPLGARLVLDPHGNVVPERSCPPATLC